MSLVGLLYDELSAPPTYSTDREDALLDFAATPYRAEKVLSLGTLLALDAFLQMLVIMPVRAALAVFRAHWRSPDSIQLVVIMLAYRVLQHVNTSSIYRHLRGQAGITMFVLYSLTEVCDKFLCSVGHEMISCLTSHRTMHSRRRLLAFSLVNFLYLVTHSFVLMWQLVTLNLAVNSFSNALLSFILNNLFSEIKAAVFKKFNKDSLFQLTCADITQRFQYYSLLSVIVLRNLLNHWVSVGGPWFTASSLATICGPAMLVAAVIVVVDWLKIAYIVNFNNLNSAELFRGYWADLCQDFRANRQHQHRSLVSKQAGLPVAPLVIVCVRMFARGGVIWTPVTVLFFVLMLIMKMCLAAWTQRLTARKRKRRRIPNKN